MTRDEFMRLPRFLGRVDTEDHEPDKEYVSVASFGFIPLTHCSGDEDYPALEPIGETLIDKPIFATQLWLRVERILQLLDSSEELMEPVSLVDHGCYSVIGNGHHRMAARQVRRK